MVMFLLSQANNWFIFFLIFFKFNNSLPKNSTQAYGKILVHPKAKGDFYGKIEVYSLFVV